MSRLSDPPTRIFLGGALAVLIGLASMQLWNAGSMAPAAERADVAPGDLLPAFEARVAAIMERLATAPDAHLARLELARLLHDAHRHDEAIGHFEAYVAAQPDDRQGWLDLAGAYAAVERWDHAERASMALLERFPGDAAALYNLGAVAANRGDDVGARRWWSELMDLGEGEPLAAQAAASLARLDALAWSGAPAPGSGYAGRLPDGHPPIARSDGWTAAAYIQSRRPGASR